MSTSLPPSLAKTFLDSSALYAFLDRRDGRNANAVERWATVLGTDELITHNYVLAETTALLQVRIGIDAVRDLQEELVPAMTVHWVNRELHDDAVRAVVASERRAVSLVDRVSFLVMRLYGITRAFAYDAHFQDQGFELLG